jgi:hypothetical protein
LDAKVKFAKIEGGLTDELAQTIWKLTLRRLAATASASLLGFGSVRTLE